MPTTFIFGATGRTGQYLTRILTQETTPPHKVHGLTRSSTSTASSKLAALGATLHEQSFVDADVEALASTIKQCAPDAVVWVAGGDGLDASAADAVDRKGAIKSMDATAAAGVKRFVLVSSADVRDRENRPVPGWYDKNDEQMSGMVWGAVAPFMRAKFDADKELVLGNERRGLRYTIVRPGGLVPEDGKGMVQAGKVHIGMISREDVARVVAHCLQDEETVGLAFDVCKGDMSVSDAVRGVTQERTDCFEGHY